MSLEAGAKICVLHVDGYPEKVLAVTRERVLRVDGLMVTYDGGMRNQTIRLDDEGMTWCRGWDSEAIAALVAAWRLTQSTK